MSSDRNSSETSFNGKEARAYLNKGILLYCVNLSLCANLSSRKKKSYLLIRVFLLGYAILAWSDLFSAIQDPNTPEESQSSSNFLLLIVFL